MEVGVGTTIGGYRLDALIGQGGMGVVYAGTNVQSGLRVAVKLLTPELGRQPGFRERFVRESRYANSLRHPNVIEVYDAGEQDGVLYIVMQLVEGRDLKTVFASEGALDPHRAVRLLEQVASALDAAHSQGLLHRDIKPGNVMIAAGSEPGEPEHCFLTDFGLSKNVSSDSIALTAQGEFVGTIDYTAPELVLGKEADSRLDVYSLGCLMYECLAGAPPFNKERDVEVLYAHIQDPPPQISHARGDVPAALDHVIAKAMAKKPDDRYATCSEFIDSARAVLGEPAAAAPPPPPPPPPPPAATSAGAPPAADAVPRETLVLRAVAGPAEGTEITVGDELVIGRQAPGPGQLAGDIEISRRHARITREPGGSFVLEDLGSTNGTFVNGQQVTSRALAADDEVELGDTRLLVVAPAPAAPPPEPDTPPQSVPGVTTFAAVPTEPMPPPFETPEPAEVPAPPADESGTSPGSEPPAATDAPPQEPSGPPPSPPPGVTTFAAVPEEVAPDVEPPAPPPVVETEPVPEADVAAPVEAEPPAVEAGPVEGGPEGATATPVQTIGVRLEVDTANGTLTVEVDDPSGPVRFVRRDGDWTIER